MGSKVSRESSIRFLFLAASFLILFCPVIGKAQNNSVVNLADTVWDNDKNPIRKFNANDNSDTEIIYFLGFYKQGKVKAVVITDKSAGAIEKWEYEYDTNINNGRTDYRQVLKRSPTLPSVKEQTWEGTYRIKGKIVYLDFPSFTIEATVTASSIDGILNHKDTNKDEPVLFTRTARPNNSSSDTNNSLNPSEKRQLAETLFAQTMTLERQANDLKSKGKILEAQEKFREAAGILSKIIEIKLDTKHYIIDAYFNRGVVKLELEDYKGAIDDFSNAIEISTPLKQSAIKSYSEVEAKAKSSSEDPIIQAAQWSALEEKIKPEERAAKNALTLGYHYLAIIKKKLGDKAGACEDYRMFWTSGFGINGKMPNDYCN